MWRRHRALILNWFKAKGQISNGIVEGLNNKAQLTIRKFYGFRSPEILEMALYHALGKRPEPRSPMNSTDKPFCWVSGEA